jgi:KUP system potassium uptake protein
VTKPPLRLPRNAAFLTAAAEGIPLPLSRFLKHNNAIHERVLLTTVLSEEKPRVPDDKRVTVIPLCNGIDRVILRFGFTEKPDVKEGLRYAVGRQMLSGIDIDDLSFYLGREIIIPTAKIRGMAVWRERLFSFLQRNAERTAAYFCIPTAQVVEIGTEIEI